MRVLPLILARGGSKRLPNKNMLKIGNKTLVEIAMEQALEVFGEACLSTESPEIIKHIEDHQYAGSFKVFKRPEALASDTSPPNLSIIHAAMRRRLSAEDHVCLLQPTSPLRSAEDIMRVVSCTLAGGPAYSSIDSGVPDSKPSGAVYCGTVWRWRDWPAHIRDWCAVPIDPVRCLDIDTKEQYEEAVRRYDEQR